METLKEKHKEMIDVYDKHKQKVQEYDTSLKVESQKLITKLQRYFQFMLVDAQREFHKNMEFHQRRVKK